MSVKGELQLHRQGGMPYRQAWKSGRAFRTEWEKQGRPLLGVSKTLLGVKIKGMGRRNVGAMERKEKSDETYLNTIFPSDTKCTISMVTSWEIQRI
jgi:hypothetical protein